MKAKITSEHKIEQIPILPKPRNPQHAQNFRNSTKQSIAVARKEHCKDKFFAVSVTENNPFLISDLKNAQDDFTRASYKVESYNQIKMIKPAKRKETRTLQPRAKKRIRQLVNYVNTSIKSVRAHFITLTFTQNKRDYANKKEQHKHQNSMLSEFLENIRKTHNIHSYIWVAEIQDGKRNDYRHSTGNLHYHVIINTVDFINYFALNIYWLKVLERNDYEVISRSKLLEHTSAFNQDHEQTPLDWQLGNKKSALYHMSLSVLERGRTLRQIIPEATHVTKNSPINNMVFHPVQWEKLDSLKKLQNYLTKYITKSESAGIYGRVWGCSQNLSRLITSMEVDNSIVDELPENTEKYEFTMKLGKHDYTFTYYQVEDKMLIKYIDDSLRKVNNDRRDHIYRSEKTAKKNRRIGKQRAHPHKKTTPYVERPRPYPSDT